MELEQSRTNQELQMHITNLIQSFCQASQDLNISAHAI